MAFLDFFVQKAGGGRRNGDFETGAGVENSEAARCGLLSRFTY